MAGPVHRRGRHAAATSLIVALLAGTPAAAESLPVANASFESPATGFVTLDLGGWQRVPQPDTYPDNDWNTLAGIFLNSAPDKPDHILNLDGDQALWLFARPGPGIFQDLAAAGGSEPLRFEAGRSYAVEADLLGGGGNMQDVATLSLFLEFPDGDGGFLPVTSLVVAQRAETFPDRQHLHPFQAESPVLTTDHPAVGQPIRLRIQSTTSEELKGGYWDVDHVRVTATRLSVEPPVLTLSGPADSPTIRWATESGRRYRLERSTGLDRWDPVGEWISGDGAEAAASVGPTAESHVFFRLQAAPLP